MKCLNNRYKVNLKKIQKTTVTYELYINDVFKNIIFHYFVKVSMKFKNRLFDGKLNKCQRYGCSIDKVPTRSIRFNLTRFILEF